MLEVACPTCGKSVAWSPESPWRPFCSERCRLIDLGAWFSEEHAIPGEDAEADAGPTPEDEAS
ncbi:MAG TPA: DNA gyrase inhibitor YacG [Gammaproteobacteria bacterium]|nr:DNA gyrase inhibitor YacG [Gammaproteobacteria bacterium]